ncbi:hypothetical protein GCM10009682_35740 [Luedemannella flava]|uniref:Uncharacterized protein n=1 Tax=Luedemannella flava TaxID=349316 RepID=A0ABP4YI52_9ACTN
MTRDADALLPPPDQTPTYCRTCRRALNRWETAGGQVDFIHAAEQRGASTDHPARPAPITEITDPIIECDFCSATGATWIYVCADQETDTRIVTSKTVDLRDYHQRHHAARTRNVQTTAGPLSRWGTRWSACTPCAERIEDRDLMGLIARVTDAMPAKFTRGKKLVSVRGLLHENYSTVFATMRPGRGRIIPQHPLGVWDSTGAGNPEGVSSNPESVSSAAPTGSVKDRAE